MRLPWQKSASRQLDLPGEGWLPFSAVPLASPALETAEAFGPTLPSVSPSISTSAPSAPPPTPATVPSVPNLIPAALIDEDPANPRAVSPDDELDALADDIRLRGILVPLAVHPADARRRYRLHFGARRLRAAKLAGLHDVPVYIREAPADPYAQVCENLKRAALPPLDLARFIREQVDAGQSNAEVARRLGINLTTVAHHLSLLELPPVLNEALKSGRCTSQRTLHELSRLSKRQPAAVRALVEGQGALTRKAVASLRADDEGVTESPAARLIAQADAACERLEKLLRRIQPPGDQGASPELLALRGRIADLAKRWSPGSDGQTPAGDPT